MLGVWFMQCKKHTKYKMIHSCAGCKEEIFHNTEKEKKSLTTKIFEDIERKSMKEMFMNTVFITFTESDWQNLKQSWRA